MTLRLFSIMECELGDYASDCHFSVAVWREHMAEAMDYFGEQWKREGGDWPDERVKIHAEDVTDKVPAGEVHRDLPCEESRPVVLRAIGWLEDGEDSCDTCGLYAMGLDEFAVCDECRQCKECGCDCEDGDA